MLRIAKALERLCFGLSPEERSDEHIELSFPPLVAFTLRAGGPCGVLENVAPHLAERFV